MFTIINYIYKKEKQYNHVIYKTDFKAINAIMQVIFH